MIADPIVLRGKFLPAEGILASRESVGFLACLLLLVGGLAMLDGRNRASGLTPPDGSAGEGAVSGPPPALPSLLFKPVAPQEAVAVNASIPFAAEPSEPARPFKLKPRSTDYLRALDCLTAVVYYEAANETLDGQRGVAQVVLNRVRHPAFPASVCAVVYQGFTRDTGCQFTFTCDGALARAPSREKWIAARKVADAALTGSVLPAVGTATHYHADYVVPYWAWSLAKNSQIGRHIFYRWTGGWGRRPAFRQRYAGERSDPAQLRTAALALHGSGRKAELAGPVEVSLSEDPRLDLLSVVHLLADEKIESPASDAIRRQLSEVAGHAAVAQYRAYLTTMQGAPDLAAIARKLGEKKPSEQLAALNAELDKFAATGSYISLREGSLLADERKRMQRELQTVLSEVQPYAGIEIKDVRLLAIPALGKLEPPVPGCTPSADRGSTSDPSRWLVDAATAYIGNARDNGCASEAERQAVAAMLVRIKARADGPGAGERQLAQEVKAGGKLVPKLARSLEEFEANRHIFATLTEFRSTLFGGPARARRS